MIVFDNNKTFKHEEKESTHKGTAKRIPEGEKESRRLCGRWLWSGMAEPFYVVESLFCTLI